MKKLIIIPIIIFLVNTINAQYNGYFSKDLYAKNKKYPGWVILKNGDKKEGFIEARDPVANEKAVHFYEKEEDKKPFKKYEPSEVKEYQLGHLHYVTMPYSGGIVSKDQFVLVQQDGEGAIKSCYWYDMEISQQLRGKYQQESDEQYFNAQFPSKVVYFREGVKPLEHQSLLLGFAKKMAELTKDVPEISKKITDKEKGYKMLDIYDIIKEFNTKMAGSK